MANTVLNAGTTGMASTNPQANVNQVPNANTGSQINPITIPIQIQPQVAQTPQSVQQLVQNQTNAQAAAQVVQPSRTTAPSPQTYQGNSQNNNVVNFDQIYSAYQSQYGNTYNSNPNMSNSGVKKTSLGTTIVTPTVSNLNTVQGQYQSAYSDTINGIIGQMLSNVNNGFSYDPTTDSSLRVASEYAANSTLQSLAGSGVLNSSSTSERVARIVADLIPQYEEKAHNRWTEYLSQLADTAQLVMNFDNQQFAYWADAKDREFQEKEFQFNKQQKELENAWKRVDELGYVDNNASTILGVKVGTLSGAAREAKEQREYELAKMREQYELERENDIAITKLKSELELSTSKQLASYQANIDKDVYKYKATVDTAKSKELSDYQLKNDKSLYKYRTALDTEQSKELAAYQNSLNKSTKEYEYQLAQKYGSSGSNSTSSDYTNYSTHDEIIQNRWGIEDPITGQISVSDETTDNNDAVYNYLANAYAAGRISQKDFAALIAKYGITAPNQSKASSKVMPATGGTSAFGYATGGGLR